MIYGILNPAKPTSVSPTRPSATQHDSLATYSYDALGDDEIRVIALDERVKYSDELVIELRVRKRTDSAPYEAVSYVWGENGQTGVVKVRTPHGLKAFTVRSNIITMLRHLRERRSLQPLWIDAICIDQNSDSEKDAQVQEMGDVYQKASQTLVWLGDHKEHLLSNLERAWPYRHHVNRLKKDVEPLLNNVYFTRRWIIQELFFSKKVLLLDNYRTLNFKVLEDASEFILKHVHHLHHVDDAKDHIYLNVDNIKDRRLLHALHLMQILRELRSQSAQHHDFMRLLVSAHLSRCEKGHDRIYALIALEKGETVRAVDYETGVEKLFKEFAEDEMGKSLETLYCSGAFPDTYDNTSADTEASPLPSWVPDWRSERAWIPISLMHGQNVGETSFGPALRIFPKPEQKTEFNVMNSTLVVRGAIIGTIERAQSVDTIGGLLKFYQNHKHSETDEDITRLLRTLTLDSVKDGELAKSWLKLYRNSDGTQCPLASHSANCTHLDNKQLYECNVLRRIEDVITGRSAFVTREGHWSVGPHHLKEDDFMVRLDGCRFPFVMRRQVCLQHFLA
ncbi:ankyrin and HET domain-containing protein [Stagonosporopsis vannaccii]|nr:ankyrin and HET domain-containing protein [Stagonosporopsis vannaccii]